MHLCTVNMNDERGSYALHSILDHSPFLCALPCKFQNANRHGHRSRLHLLLFVDDFASSLSISSWKRIRFLNDLAEITVEINVSPWHSLDLPFHKRRRLGRVALLLTPIPVLLLQLSQRAEPRDLWLTICFSKLVCVGRRSPAGLELSFLRV